jgi:ferredoxin-NADP reductase
VSGNVHEAVLTRITPLARGVFEYRLEAEEPLGFRPGQFISLKVGADGDGNPILRSYSLASSPGVRELALIVKIVPGGTASSWFAARAVGDRVSFTGPMGFFVLELQHAGDLVFGATGVGIAPVLPMLDEALARNELGRIHLFWGNRDREDLFWLEELQRRRSQRFSYDIYLSRATPEWDGARGRITAGLLDAAPNFSHPTFYLVGNGAMVRDVKTQLVARGFDRKRQIRNEVFFD